jgi:hypothetical protein
MSFLNKIKDRLVREPSGMPLSMSASGGIGNRCGTLGFEDDLSSVSRIALQYRVASAFILGLVDAGCRHALQKRDTNMFGHLVLNIYRLTSIRMYLA